MAKRPSLAANVKAAAGEPPILPVVRLPEPPPAAAEPVAPPEVKRSASRVGRKAVYAWIDPAEHRKLKKLSLDTDRSIDALVTEAVHLLFARHGLG
jgi:hypothetical protein